MSIHWWMDKEDVGRYTPPTTHTMEHYLAIKKNAIADAICYSNMDGPKGYHTKWSKSHRER